MASTEKSDIRRKHVTASNIENQMRTARGHMVAMRQSAPHGGALEMEAVNAIAAIDGALGLIERMDFSATARPGVLRRISDMLESLGR